MSHQVRFDTQVKMTDHGALSAALTILGGTVTTVTGYGISFRLPKWSYQLTVRPNGEMFFDGDDQRRTEDINLLQELYIIEKAVLFYEQQGQMTERQPDGSLLVYFPDGGVVTVYPKGMVDANGFHGASCAAATGPLLEALGVAGQETRKEAYIERQLEIGQE